MIEYGDEYEEFVPEISSSCCKYKENNSIVIANLNGSGISSATVFGLVEAIPGNKYHWRIKAVDDDTPNVGIMEASKCNVHGKDAANDYWWNKTYAWSYYGGDGEIYNGATGFDPFDINRRAYGKPFKKHDIVDIWLDLKENNDLSFGKNGESFGKAADLKPNTTYKLVIGLYGGSVELLHFDAQY